MKKIFLVMIVAFISNLTIAQTEPIKFAKEVHDFGKIVVGTPVTYDFSFTNVSGAPITVETATASCGCTTPTWPQAPVMAGKSNVIKAGFNAAGVGVFEKTITVKLQGVDNPKIITIKGEVLSKEDIAKLNIPSQKAKVATSKQVTTTKPKVSKPVVKRA